MLISVSNKPCCNGKPRTNNEKTEYFDGLKFTQKNLNAEQLKYCIYNGYTFTFLYTHRDENDTFIRTSGSKSFFYGSQFVFVDIDESDIPLKEFIGSLKYKPTFAHTTFSNLTEYKHGKYCYHLMYYFDSVIVGEENYLTIFERITAGMPCVDVCARDCHRLVFTSLSTLDNFEYFSMPENVYKVSDFVKQADLGLKIPRIPDEERIKLEMSKSNKWDFNIDPEFFNDLNSLPRKDFILKYINKYPVQTKTSVPKELFNDHGYADLRGIPMYEVPSSKPAFKDGKRVNLKVAIGNRGRTLWFDAIVFLAIRPDMTKENLVYALVSQVFSSYDNSDSQMTNNYIINKAKCAWCYKDISKIKSVKERKIALDYSYWVAHGYNKGKHSIVMAGMKQMHKDDYFRIANPTMAIEDNIEEMKTMDNLNFKVPTVKTVLKWCKEDNIVPIRRKDKIDSYVEFIYNKYNGEISALKISKIITEQYQKVSSPTVKAILKEKHLELKTSKKKNL